jgi:putative transcriptional regulator
MHHYRECGLDDVWLVDGYARARGPYGATLAVENVEALHEAIAADIVESPAKLTGDTFRFLRKRLVLSQVELGRLIGADVQAVARWEKGRSAVPGAADRLLRALWAERARGRPAVAEIVESLREPAGLVPRKRRFRLLEKRWKAAA